MARSIGAPILMKRFEYFLIISMSTNLNLLSMLWRSREFRASNFIANIWTWLCSLSTQFTGISSYAQRLRFFFFFFAPVRYHSVNCYFWRVANCKNNWWMKLWIVCFKKRWIISTVKPGETNSAAVYWNAHCLFLVLMDCFVIQNALPMTFFVLWAAQTQPYTNKLAFRQERRSLS